MGRHTVLDTPEDGLEILTEEERKEEAWPALREPSAVSYVR